MKIEAHTFHFPTQFIGLSQKSVEEHVKLYTGYVKHANIIMEILEGAQPEPGDERLPYAKSEVQRRFSFEYNGIRNHEYYFEQIEVAPQPIDTSSAFAIKIAEQFGSWDGWITQLKNLAKTRGIGWAILYWDTERKAFLHAWVDEQHLGQLNSCQFVFGIDMWEHSYVADYHPSGKGQYIDDYLTNVNWNVVVERFNKLSK